MKVAEGDIPLLQVQEDQITSAESCNPACTLCHWLLQRWYQVIWRVCSAPAQGIYLQTNSSTWWPWNTRATTLTPSSRTSPHHRCLVTTWTPTVSITFYHDCNCGWVWVCCGLFLSVFCILLVSSSNNVIWRLLSIVLSNWKTAQSVSSLPPNPRWDRLQPFTTVGTWNKLALRAFWSFQEALPGTNVLILTQTTIFFLTLTTKKGLLTGSPEGKLLPTAHSRGI